MVNDDEVSPRVDGGEGQVVQRQRARILEAMVDVVYERGYAGASVALVCAQAKVSRRTFYELYESFEECFLAVLDHGMEVMAAMMSHAFVGEENWLDRLLAAEAAVLTFLDGQPKAARVLLVETLAAGSWALERRERNVAALRELIVEQLEDSPVGGDFPPLASAGVMASLLGIMQDHLLRNEQEPLISLLGPLMGVITTPYLPAEDVAREIHRGEQLARKLQAEGGAQACSSGVAESEREAAAVEVPALLGNLRAVRARRCVRYLAEHPGSSNRQIAAGIGITHQGQISKLLASLQGSGLLVKEAYGSGRPNAWELTAHGRELAAHFELHEGD